ncbi:uncharacterized protein PG986_011019 [Apiospora aurea]|uniref:Uncharacterized protein n=1 Tax=Apiospora aurea TaxID=335848 RepID=A0ABR1Q3X8_9PEZI
MPHNCVITASMAWEDPPERSALGQSRPASSEVDQRLPRLAKDGYRRPQSGINLKLRITVYKDLANQSGPVLEEIPSLEIKNKNRIPWRGVQEQAIPTDTVSAWIASI